MRYAQTTDNRYSVLTTTGDDGCRDQGLSFDDDRHVLITLVVQLCVEHDGRLGVTASRGPLALYLHTCGYDRDTVGQH